MRILFSLVVVLLLAGCQKKEPAPEGPQKQESLSTVSLAVPSERSAHFEAVNRHLELGGTLYGYVDVDGDTLKLAAGLSELANEIAAAQPAAAPFLKQNYAQIFEELGFNDIKAAGLSSVRESTGGFRNRAFFYTPHGRRGLLAGLGGPAAPYVYTNLAPADADFYSETEFDLPAVYGALRAAVARVGGESFANMLDTQLKSAGAPAGFSTFELIQSLRGRGATVLRIDPEKNFVFPGTNPLIVPGFSLLVRVDGIADSLKNALAKLPALSASNEKDLTVYTLKSETPVKGIAPVLVVEGSALYFATTIEFFRECHSRSTGLGQSPEFQKALAAVGTEGNGLAYVSPRFFARLRQIASLNDSASPEVKRVLNSVVRRIPDVQRPIITERINLPDGILVRSQSNRSLKQEVAMMSIYNPVTVGLVAAMAIPAFQKVRLASQEKAIQNNLRLFSAAADQLMLETNRTAVAYADIVGPGKYLAELKSVAGEDYRRLIVRATDKKLSVRTKAGNVISITR